MFHQGYSRDPTTRVDRTKQWLRQSQLRVLFPLSSRSETAILLCVCHEREQATALPIVTTKSRRFMGCFRLRPKNTPPPGEFCAVGASQQFCPLDFRSGSITDQGRPTIKHRFLVCCILNNRRNLLHRRGCPPCAKTGYEQVRSEARRFTTPSPRPRGRGASAEW